MVGIRTQDMGATVKALAGFKTEVIVLQLGKLTLNMLAAVAEMEWDLLVERARSGLARAKAVGKVLSRPFKATDTQRAEIVAKRQGRGSISSSSRDFGISRASGMRVRGYL